MSKKNEPNPKPINRDMYWVKLTFENSQKTEVIKKTMIKGTRCRVNSFFTRIILADYS